MCELFTSPYLSGTAVSVGEACIKRNIPIVPKLSVASKNCETVYPVPLGCETHKRQEGRGAGAGHPLLQKYLASYSYGLAGVRAG